ncbi:unnamed protein product, partial [Symbiodinium sp. CCMP2456]
MVKLSCSIDTTNAEGEKAHSSSLNLMVRPIRPEYEKAANFAAGVVDRGVFRSVALALSTVRLTSLKLGDSQRLSPTGGGRSPAQVKLGARHRELPAERAVRREVAISDGYENFFQCPRCGDQDVTTVRLGATSMVADVVSQQAAQIQTDTWLLSLTLCVFSSGAGQSTARPSRDFLGGHRPTCEVSVRGEGN